MIRYENGLFSPVTPCQAGSKSACELGRRRPWPWAGLWGSDSRTPWPQAARVRLGQIAVAISQMRTLRPGQATPACLAAPGHTWCLGRARPVRPRPPSGSFCGCASPARGRSPGHEPWAPCPVLTADFVLSTGRDVGAGMGRAGLCGAGPPLAVSATSGKWLSLPVPRPPSWAVVRVACV